MQYMKILHCSAYTAYKLANQWMDSTSNNTQGTKYYRVQLYIQHMTTEYEPNVTTNELNKNPICDNLYQNHCKTSSYKNEFTGYRLCKTNFFNF